MFFPELTGKIIRVSNQPMRKGGPYILFTAGLQIINR
jgi:hypothetical protein